MNRTVPFWNTAVYTGFTPHELPVLVGLVETQEYQDQLKKLMSDS